MLLLVWTSCCNKLFALDLILMSSAEDLDDTILATARGSKFVSYLVCLFSFIACTEYYAIVLCFPHYSSGK